MRWLAENELLRRPVYPVPVSLAENNLANKGIGGNHNHAQNYLKITKQNGSWGRAAVIQQCLTSFRKSFANASGATYNRTQVVIKPQLSADRSQGAPIPCHGWAWCRMMANPTLADAILDRLTHATHRIPLKGESMRKQTADLFNPSKTSKSVNSPPDTLNIHVIIPAPIHPLRLRTLNRNRCAFSQE